MKRIILCLFITSLAVIIIFLSCKKERSCEGCINGNKPPIAIAGPDQVITLPTDSTLLDGSASNDPDGTISVWLWKKISGPASFNIVTAASAGTIVRNPDTGVYRFELKVTDNGNLSATDTVQITVTDPRQPNRPPVAHAGADQTISLPANTINIDGSASTDPDNNITSYTWIKISGPSSFNITNANAIQTQANNLVQGVYQFELKVTDAGGLFSKDTVQVNVNSTPASSCEPFNRTIINAQLIPFGNLSIPRSGIAMASIDNKIFFAGGYNNTSGDCSRVDIFDIPTQTWSVAELSVARSFISAVATENKIFFAGGCSGSGSLQVSSRVDIYDLQTQTWSIAELTQARAGIATSVVGNKVFFAGGYGDVNGPGLPSSRVDIFNTSTQTWSTAELSEARAYITAVSAENKVHFGGGDPANGNGFSSKKIDIYNNGTDTWSVSILNEQKAFCAGFYKNNKIYWAGGATYMNLGNVETCTVEIKDINSQVSTFSNLFEPKSYIKALEKDNKVIIIKHEALWDLQSPTWNFDIYDVTTNSWSIGFVNQFTIGGPGSSISHNNTIYLTGGWLSNQVWKLEF